MAGSWDGGMKRLVEEAPQDFISWLIQGAQFDSELSPHLQGRNIDADILYRIIIDGSPYLFHLEFQRRSDPDMAKRLWEYNVLATSKFDLSVYSFVIYLKKNGKIAEPPYIRRLHNGREVHRFYFTAIKLWEIPTDTFKGPGLQGLLPLLPLTRDGPSRSVVEEIIDGLCPAGEAPKSELLSLAYGFAALVLNDAADRAWLRRRFSMLEDILEGTWAFQELKQRGLEEGRKQGIEEGIKKGIKEGIKEGIREAYAQEVQRQRKMLITFVRARFPALIELAEERARALSVVEDLQALILNVGLAQSEEEARQHLNVS